MDVQLDRDSSVPLYLQLCQSIRGMILDGRLPEGFRLPPERTLAQALRVNRTTVLNAYRELKAEGLLGAHVGRGTAVLPRRFPEKEPAAPDSLPWGQLMREAGAGVSDPLLRDLLELTERRDVISLAVGLPAPELMPLGDLGRLMGKLLEEEGASALLHSPTEGVSTFREVLSGLMTARGIRCQPSEAMVTSGSQQSLDLLARVFLEPGDSVVVEEPSYFGALRVFTAAGARLIGVPADQQGMRTDLLEALLERHRPKLIYTLPTFQNPSGVVMSLGRRGHLLELSRRFRIPIVEDDPYSELRYEGEALPSLKALDQTGHVIYLCSFSKVLFPGLRIGWLAASRPVLRRLVLVKQAVDLHSTTLGQMLVERFIREGLYQRHVRAVRAEYTRRRDAMEEALRASAPPELSWAKPKGGFYFWCTFPSGVSQAQLMARAGQASVAYLPGEACFVNQPPENHFRLNFTYAAPAQAREGITRLMRALREACAQPFREERATEATTPLV